MQKFKRSCLGFLVFAFAGLIGCAGLAPDTGTGPFAWQQTVETVRQEEGWAAASEFFKQHQSDAIASHADTDELFALTSAASEHFHMLEDLQNAALVEERAVAAFSERDAVLFEARARALLAESLYWLGDSEAAGEMTEIAFALIEDHARDDPDLAVRLYVLRAMIATDGDDPKAPLAPISQAQSIADNAGVLVSHETRAALFAWLSRVHRQVAVAARVAEEEGVDAHETRARRYAQQAVGEARADGDLQSAAIYLETLSRVEWNMGFREEAVTHLGEGLALMEQLGLDRGRDYALLAAYMTFYTNRTGRHEESIAWGEKAMDVMMTAYERAMIDPGGPTPDLHAGLTFASVAALETMLDGASASANLSEDIFNRIFQISQLNKMTAMAHAVLRASHEAAGRGPKVLAAVDERQALQLEWLKVENQLEVWRRAGRSNDEPEHLLQTKADLTDRIDALTRKIADEDPLYDRLWRTNGATVDMVRDVLGEDEAFLLLTSLYTDLYVVVITTDTFWVHVAEFEPGEACELASRIRNGLTEGAPLKCDSKGGALDLEHAPRAPFDIEAAHDYYRRVFGPAAHVLDEKTSWIISVARTQSAVPMGALLRTKPGPEMHFAEMDWLGKAKALTYTPSAQAFIVSRRQDAPRSGEGGIVVAGAPCVGRYRGEDCRVRMMEDASRASSPALLASYFRDANLAGDAAEAHNLVGLPGAYRELSQVLSGGWSRAESLIAEDFTEARFKDRDWSDTDTVLIATHVLSAGDFSLSQPALVLSPPARGAEAGSNDDGLLTAGEIAQLSLGDKLIILSGCSTAGPGGSPRGEMFAGLTLGFLQAGAKNVLATHFEVEDGFASDFVPSIVTSQRGLRERSVSEALRDSVQQLLHDGSATHYHHPRHWAGFVVYGAGVGRVREVPSG